MKCEGCGEETVLKVNSLFGVLKVDTGKECEVCGKWFCQNCRIADSAICEECFAEEHPEIEVKDD